MIIIIIVCTFNIFTFNVCVSSKHEMSGNMMDGDDPRAVAGQRLLVRKCK